MIVVVPRPTPVTRPETGSIVATAVLLLLHGQPVLAPSLSVIVPPRHTLVGPDIATGNADVTPYMSISKGASEKK